jgi:hypothetical protein
MATEPAKKTVSKPETAKPGDTPINPGTLQQGENTSAPLTTRVPRGVNEPASDTIADEPAAADLQRHVKSVIDKEEAQGYRGDPNKNRTPNEAYTLRGVGRGDPTPETTVYTPTSK